MDIFPAAKQRNCKNDENEKNEVLVPELSIGFPAGIGSGSLMSTTTTSEVRNVLATEDACSKQHLTTYNKKPPNTKYYLLQMEV